MALSGNFGVFFSKSLCILQLPRKWTNTPNNNSNDIDDDGNNNDYESGNDSTITEC